MQKFNKNKNVAQRKYFMGSILQDDDDNDIVTIVKWLWTSITMPSLETR